MNKALPTASFPKQRGFYYSGRDPAGSPKPWEKEC